MVKRVGWLIVFISFIFSSKAFCQQDVDFQLSAHFLNGQNVIKVKCDSYDPYVWVLAQNDQVYRINSQTMTIDNYTAAFAAYNNLQFTDIAGYNQDTVFVATVSKIIEYKQGVIKTIGSADGLTDSVTTIGVGNANDAIYNATILMIGTTAGFGFYNIKTEQLEYANYSSVQETNYGPINIFTATYRTQMYTPVLLNFFGYNPEEYTAVIEAPYQSSEILLSPANYQSVNTAYYTLYRPGDLGVYLGNSFWGNKNGMFQQSVEWGPLTPYPYHQFLNGIKVNKISDILGLTNFSDPNNSPPIEKDNLLIGTDTGFYFSNSLYSQIDTSMGIVSLFHYDALGNIAVNDIGVNTNATVQLSASYTACENGVWLATADGLYYLTTDYAKYLSPNIQLAQSIYFDLPGQGILAYAPVCSGSSLSILFSPNYLYNYNNTIQWQKMA
jgi:hypothetical protein